MAYSYNQQTETSEQICITETSSGECGYWETTTVKTIHWFDTIYLLSKFIFGIMIVIAIIKFRYNKRRYNI